MPADAALGWDPSSIYATPDDPAIDVDLRATLRAAAEFDTRHRGRVAALDAAGLAQALAALDALRDAAERPAHYARLASAVHPDDPALMMLWFQVRSASADVTRHTAFFDDALRDAPAEVVERWLDAEALAPYAWHLRRVRRARSATPADGRADAAADHLDRVIRGMPARARHPDREIRAAACRAREAAFAARGPELAAIADELLGHRIRAAEQAGHGSPFARALADEDLDPHAVDGLMRAVEAAHPTAQRYLRAKASALGVSGPLAAHDIDAPLPGGDAAPMSFGDARRTIVAAFGRVAPLLGREVERFFVERRIDARAGSDQGEGAWCLAMTPGLDPFVRAPFDGHSTGLIELAHELGHGVHYALAGRRQSRSGYHPTRALAETASVFGELVVFEELLADARDADARRAHLAARLDRAVSTLMLGVGYARFEQRVYAERARGPLAPARYCALWQAMQAELYGDAVRWTADARWGWLTAPHMMRWPFYTLAYALAQLLVFALYRTWQREGPAFAPAYLELLSAGGSAPPAELLARLGVRLDRSDLWADGLGLVQRWVERFADGSTEYGR